MKMYFKLLPKSGSHAQPGDDGEVVIYEASEGRIIESKNDLVKMFPNKFKKVDLGSLIQTADTPEKEKTPVQKAAEEGAKDVMPPEKPKKKKEKYLGEDCTSKFPSVEEQALKVFYAKGKGYFITEDDDPFVALNKDNLKKEEVDFFVKDYLKG